ncbi:MAG: hypothetical protein WBM50_27420 [Acidimicrobiales bacterium]
MGELVDRAAHLLAVGSLLVGEDPAVNFHLDDRRCVDVGLDRDLEGFVIGQRRCIGWGLVVWTHDNVDSFKEL